MSSIPVNLNNNINTNVQAITFSNQKIRPMADLLYSAYLTAKAVVQAWNTQSVSSVIANDTNTINDGAATDGRSPITDAQATAIITRCMELISWMELGLVASPFNASPASLATLGTVTAVEVNGKQQF